MNNLHLSLTEFRNESRVLKEASSISTLELFDKVFVAALHADGLLERESFGEGVEAKRFKLKTRNLSKGLFAQAIKYLEYTFKVTHYYWKKDITMINIHALSLLPVGYFLKLLYGAKLIYDTHELETETNGAHGARKKIAKLVERLLIKHADYVFVVSENIASWYEREYKIMRPTVILNAPRYYELQQKNVFRESLGIRKEQVIVLYQGGLNKSRGVDTLLTVFSQRQDDSIVIVFMGNGEMEEQVKQLASINNKVFFHPMVPANYVLEYTISADIGIHMIRNTCLNHDYCMPNKLFEYAMAGLPVIVSDMKEMREMVEDYQMGLVVDASDEDMINQAIDKMVKTDLNKFKLNARKAAEENAWEVQEVKMLGVYQAMSF